ncbi:MAG: hypothetical protein WB562_17040 [Candidatus Sulfotelmatobacter sp.]
MLVLREIRASGFRGIRSGPILRLGSGGLLLLGDNGVGKTSWVDAIEKPLTGRCSSVETGDQTLSWARHGAHIYCGDPPAVALVFSDGGADYEIDLQTDQATLPSSLRALLSAAKQCSFILRRRTLLDFINAKPLDRYQALGTFLNLAPYASFERGLKGLQSWLAEQILDCEDKIRRLQATLRMRLALPLGAPLDSAKILERLTQLFRGAGLAGVDEFSQIAGRSRQATELMETFGNVQKRARTNALGQQCETLPTSESLLAAAQEFLIAAEASSAEERSLTGVFFVEVLTQGLEWIKIDMLTNCPLCESPINLASVKASVEQRLASHHNLIGLRAAVRRTRSTFADEVNHRVQAFERVMRLWSGGVAGGVPQTLSSFVTRLEELGARLASSAPPDQFAQSKAEIDAMRGDELRDTLIAAVNQSKESFPNQDRYASLFAAREGGAASAETVPQLRTLDLTLQELATHNDQLTRVMAHAEAGRKTAVQALVDQVAKTANSFFQQIHPQEKIGLPALEVTERGTGSLSLTGDFHGRRGDPRGYYSEGHLDSLGLCLFLAIRRLHHDQHPELKLLVLDDVLHSIDGEHRLRTAKLIVREFGDHQIVITTHDRIWFESLKQLTRDRSFVHQKVTSWSVDAGPSISDYAAEHEWLVSETGKTAPAAARINSAGRILEETLQNLCSNLSIPVPYMLRGDYTIDPLWSSFLSFAKRHAGFTAAARGDLERIEEIRAVRNFVGAHWNEWAQQLTNIEAEEFCQSVLGFRSLTYCDRCVGFIGRIDGLDRVWSCRKEHLRYDSKVTPSKGSVKLTREPADSEQPGQAGTMPPKRVM